MPYLAEICVNKKWKKKRKKKRDTNMVKKTDDTVYNIDDKWR